MSDTATICLEMLDNNPAQMADALCKYYVQNNCKNMKYAVIDLEELAEHILAWTKAERKFFEVENDHRKSN